MNSMVGLGRGVSRFGVVRSGFGLVRVLLAVAAMMVVVACFSVVSASAEPSQEAMEIVPGSFSLTPSTFQAGAHADWTLKFDVAHNQKGKTKGDLRSTLVDYPAGFVGNSLAAPTCSVTKLLANAPPSGVGSLCPPSSQVGFITLQITTNNVPQLETYPIYNMEVTSFGVAAELGFKTVILTQLLPIMVRPQDSGITGISEDAKEIGEPHEVSLTVWGVPASHEHDTERGRICQEFGKLVVECYRNGEEPDEPEKLVEAKEQERPLLANPSACGSVGADMKVDSWEEAQPEDWFSMPVEEGLRGALATVGPFVGCERLRFDPEMKIQPTSLSPVKAESPSGLQVSLEVLQDWQEPTVLATSNVKDVTVALPNGYTINPSYGNGVVGCTPQQYAAETAFSAPGAGCPLASKLGTVDISTPVLAEKITGNVYLAQPYDNPFSEPGHPSGSLLAMYVVAKLPKKGVIVKSAGRVHADPETGQITSTFENLPQQPFATVDFKLREGTTSPLASPPLCGSYPAQAQLTPYSAPDDPQTVNSTVQIEAGVDGGGCPSGNAPPIKPTVIAGTANNVAGSYSPFYLRIDRADGEQQLTGFSTVLPPGLTGNLTGIPFCPDAQIEAARHVTGIQELNEPSCPAASEIGHSLVGAGVGSVLAWTPGKVYLAGPFNGAPFSIVSVTSATVGPFDLGTVVIRFALRINPTTAQPEVQANGSEPIPRIIQGIVTHVREIHVYMDRPNFILNPTNCNHMTIANTITGAGADLANPAGQIPVTINTPFQAANCANLSFKPKFSVSTSAKTSRRLGASLHVKLTYPTAPQGTQTNIRSVKVDLPKQLPSRLSTLQKACTAKTFELNPATCPSSSRVGQATARTPVLPVPLQGPAYFVSHGGAKFPELIVVLQGYGITIDLHGETFINEKTNITSSTFRSVPDQPVTNFELTLPQGPYSALAAITNLCKTKLKMPTAFTAQNGHTIHQTTPITVTNCPKKTHKTKQKHKHH